MTQTLDQAIASFEPSLPLAIGYSGGADSTALLLACAQKWPGQICAIHVHHGLQAAADDFAAHCEAFCKTINVPLAIIKVDAKHELGESPEAAARNARYSAFLSLKVDKVGVSTASTAIKNVVNIEGIALAQHADDQVETLLLALSRGAGLPGLAAMPAAWQRDGIQYYRPLLQVSAVDIRRWLAEKTEFGEDGAPFVEDPTNTDESFTRNRIRAKLLPALDAAFPQFRDTFARSSSHAAQAQALLNELALEDLLKTQLPENTKQLNIKQLQQLSDARMGNVLRFWLKTTHQTTPSTAQLEQLIAQIKVCTTRGHRIHIKVGRGYVERQDACIDWYNP